MLYQLQRKDCHNSAPLRRRRLREVHLSCSAVVLCYRLQRLDGGIRFRHDERWSQHCFRMDGSFWEKALYHHWGLQPCWCGRACRNERKTGEVIDLNEKRWVFFNLGTAVVAGKRNNANIARTERSFFMILQGGMFTWASLLACLEKFSYWILALMKEMRYDKSWNFQKTYKERWKVYRSPQVGTGTGFDTRLERQGWLPPPWRILLPPDGSFILFFFSKWVCITSPCSLTIIL